MAQVIEGLTPDRVRANAEQVRAEISDACARAGRDPAGVRLLAAVKYVPAADIGVLAEAGLVLLGENRAQELERKAAAWPDAGFQWDFIGHLQSRKVKAVLPLARLIHSVGSDSVIRELDRLTSVEEGATRSPPAHILIEVNVSGEEGKSGVAPGHLADVLARCRELEGVEIDGLMTMPPLAADPQHSRRWFATLAQLAADHGLPELSMGTTQDFAVAVEEGATIVRVGSRLYR
jgi:pyridoxal phosphate enzyme (YggS family)